MRFERVLHFHFGQGAFSLVDYFADKRELYLHTFIGSQGEFPGKHTLLLRFNQCAYFRVLPGAGNRLSENGLLLDGLYRSVGVGLELDLPELNHLPSGGTPYLFRSETDFLYLAVASSHEVLRTWPPDKPGESPEQ